MAQPIGVDFKRLRLEFMKDFALIAVSTMHKNANFQRSRRPFMLN